MFKRLIRNSQRRRNRQILQRSALNLRFHLFVQIGLRPLSRDEQNRSCGTFLPGETVRIMIALPSHGLPVLLVFRHVGSKNFPVKAGVFEPDFSLK